MDGDQLREFARPAHRTLYLHIGTHKTGTTTLQSLLLQKADQFLAAGIYVPQTGRPPASAGHHNIAWQLAGDMRFDPAWGTLSALVDEVAANAAPAVCVSSEDFESLHNDARALRKIRDAFKAIGYRIAVIAYLRPQAGYIESLYAELVKHGFAQTFADYLESILSDGAIDFGPARRFTFDYARLIGDFAAVFGSANMMVRPYVKIFGASLTDDFLAVIGAHANRAGIDGRTTALNAGGTFRDVLERYSSNAAAGWLSSERKAWDAPFCKNRFDPIHLPEVGRIAERFSAGNQSIAKRYGISVPCVSRRDLLADIAAALGLNPGSNARRRLLRTQGTRTATLGTRIPAHGHDHPARAFGNL